MSLFFRKSTVQIVKKDSSMLFCRFSGLSREYSYKSAFSLENLYPKSNLKLYTPNFVPEDLNAKFNGFIPMDKLTFTYSRSSGPGGQHVNSVNTKVDLRFQVKKASWISDEIKEKLFKQETSRINKEGFLIIKSDLTKSQRMNVADALERLRKMIREAAAPTPVTNPETEERIRKGQLKATRQRIFEKRVKSEIKKSRSSSDYL